MTRCQILFFPASPGLGAEFVQSLLFILLSLVVSRPGAPGADPHPGRFQSSFRLAFQSVTIDAPDSQQFQPTLYDHTTASIRPPAPATIILRLPSHNYPEPFAYRADPRNTPPVRRHLLANSFTVACEDTATLVNETEPSPNYPIYFYARGQANSVLSIRARTFDFRHRCMTVLLR
jgi:hypothetical protein